MAQIRFTEEERLAILVPRLTWEEHVDYLDEHWHAGEHVSVFAKTGQGKSHLVRYGLLPLWQRYPVLIADAKGDRDTLVGVGREVRSFPTWEARFRFQNRKPDDPKWETDPEWFKLQAPGYRWSPDGRLQRKTVDKARAIFGTALDRAFNEGGWVIVLDEVRALADANPPGLRLGSLLENLWQRGRDRPLTVIGETQSPRYVPGSMYDQERHLYIGRITDEYRQKRLSEIGGNTDLIRAALPTLEEKEFLHVDTATDRLSIVKAPPRPVSATRT